MTQFAVIDTKDNKIVDLKEYKPELHPDFKVIEVSDEVDITWEYVTETQTVRQRQIPTVDHDFARKESYPEIGAQLDSLWHDIDSGLLGENAKSGKFYQTIKKTKDRLAKGRTDITMEEMEAIMLENGVLVENEEVPSGR